MARETSGGRILRAAAGASTKATGRMPDDLADPAPASRVARPRLVALLAHRPAPALTLISAPAGSGKTTLLREWAAVSGERIVLLALDAADNDPARFWSRVAAALRMVVPALGTQGAGIAPRELLIAATEALRSPGARHAPNAPTTVALVLDDFHAIATPAIADALANLIDTPPDGLRVVIATRHDPPLPLARLRARNQLLELREAELRFTEAEADAFLRGAMGLPLDTAQVARLEERTEGWIAGLQLAALSLRGCSDVAGFLDGFAGTHRYIVDYLAGEVLAREEPAVQDFLLRTSVLDRLCAPLCAAVTACDDATAAALLEHVERANLFVLPLDDTRQWYRYHALFADFLRARLRQTLAPDEVAALHHRAAAWHEAAGLVDEAIRHALAGGDATHAARLLEAHGMDYLLRGEMATTLGWLRALPEDLLRSRAPLCTLYGGVLTNVGEFAGAERWLASAERAITAAGGPPADASAADANVMRPPPADTPAVGARGVRPLAEEEPGAFGTRLGEVRAAQAVLAGFRGEVAVAEERTRQALALLPPGNAFAQGIVVAGMAAAHWWAGDMPAAAAAFAETRAIGALTGVVHIELAGICGGGFVEMARFEPRAARATFELALRRAERPGGVTHPIVGMARAGIGTVLREWNDLDAADRALRDATFGSERWGDASLLALIYLHLARIQQARGRSADALALLDQARDECEQRQIAHQMPIIAACRAFLWLMQGDVAAAASWADASGLSFESNTAYLSEMALLTLVRVRLAQGRAAEALAGLDRIEPRARAAGRLANVHEMTMLRALAHDRRGERERALTLLARVLAAAEPQGYVRLFADEGAPMADLLTALEGARSTRQRAHASDAPLNAGALPTPAYVQRLLAAMSVRRAPLHPILPPVVGGQPAPPRDDDAGAVCLNEREREVLRLLAGGLSNAAIAAELIVAPSTVKWHVKHVYAKLGAHSRTQAVARARGLGLLE